MAIFGKFNNWSRSAILLSCYVNSTLNASAQISFLLNTAESPSLDAAARADRLSLEELNRKLERAFSETKIRDSVRPLIRSLVLLWHDHLEESHSISQGIHNAEGSFLHGIMHRREPDYRNAKYWFHRAGEHRCFPEIAKKADELLSRANATELKSKLIREGDWDAFAFVDACEKALAERDEKVASLLRQIQEIECKTLLEYFLHNS